MLNQTRFLIASLLLFSALGAAQAKSSVVDWLSQDGKTLSWQFSPYTYHYTKDPKHKTVLMIGLEREYPNQKIDGLAFFTNSFGQPTLYLYPWGGVYKNIGGIKRLSFKWTAGFLYGYLPPYDKKVPLNYHGLSPAVIPTLGYQFQSGWSAQLNFLGTAGLMLQFSKPFD